MPDTTTTTPDGTTPPPANTADGTGNQQVNWQNEAEAYKKRFNGLQSSYQKLHDEFEGTKASKFDLEQKFTGLTGEYEAKKLEWQKSLEGHETIAGELDLLKANHERLKTVVSEFPELVAYEAKGLLPDGAGDELRAKLKEFSTMLKAQGQQAAQNLVQGATPPPPSSPAGPRGAAELLAAANKAMAEGKFDEYNALYDEFIGLKKSK